MAYSTVPKCRRDGVIQLRDSGGANTLDVAYEDGNLTFSVAPKEAQNIFRDRGVITTVRKGDAAEITGSFTIHMREFTNSLAGSVLDFVNKTGAYSGNTSTGSSGTPYVEFYCIDLQYTVEGTDFGDDKDHVATISKAVVNASFTEGDPNQLTFEFAAYGGIALT